MWGPGDSPSGSTGSAPRRPPKICSSASASPPKRSCRRFWRRSNIKEINDMATRVAINGFGRIGRLVARALLQKADSGLELVSINDLADAESHALPFKRASVPGASLCEGHAAGGGVLEPLRGQPVVGEGGGPGGVRRGGNRLGGGGRRVKVTGGR